MAGKLLSEPHRSKPQSKLITNKSMNMNQKGFANIVLIIILAVLVAGGGAYYYVKKISLFSEPPQLGIKPLAPADSACTKSPNDAKSISSGYDLKIREDRQAYVDKMYTLTPCEIWADWDGVLSRKDSNELRLYIRSLGQSLRQGGYPALYEEMSRRVRDTSAAVQDRRYILGVFQHAATPEAVKQLVIFLKEEDLQNSFLIGSNDFRISAGQAIRLASMELINGSRNWAISSVLEDALSASSASYSVESTGVLAQALVYLGKPDGIAAVIKVAGQMKSTDQKYEILAWALEQVTANDPVDVMVAALFNPSVSTNRDLSRSIIKGLISIDSADSIKGVVASADSIKGVVRYMNQLTPSDNSWKKEIQLLLSQAPLSVEAKKALSE